MLIYYFFQLNISKPVLLISASICSISFFNIWNCSHKAYRIRIYYFDAVNLRCKSFFRYVCANENILFRFKLCRKLCELPYKKS